MKNKETILCFVVIEIKIIQKSWNLYTISDNERYILNNILNTTWLTMVYDLFLPRIV